MCSSDLDGTLKGHIQIVLSYSLSLTAMTVYLLSLFLTTLSVTGEIKQKQFYLVDTKPVARHHFLLGKMVGIAVINFVFLSIMGTLILGIVIFLKSYTGTEEERERLNEELLTAYRESAPDLDQKGFEALVEREYLERKSRNLLPAESSEGEIKEFLSNVLRQRLYSVRPGYRSTWKFKNIPPLKYHAEKLKLRYKFFASQAPYGYPCKMRWEIGRGADLHVHEDRVRPGEFIEFTFSSRVIGENGTVEVSFVNQDETAGRIYFSSKKGIGLLYPASHFYVNYVKGLLLIYVISCFLIVLALFSSTFLSFPVAIFLEIYILFLGIISNLIVSLGQLGNEILFGKQNIWQKMLTLLLHLLFSIVPNFGDFTPLDYLSSGEMISWGLVGESVWDLLIVRGGPLMLLGFFIFRDRKSVV